MRAFRWLPRSLPWPFICPSLFPSWLPTRIALRDRAHVPHLDSSRHRSDISWARGRVVSLDPSLAWRGVWCNAQLVQSLAKQIKDLEGKIGTHGGTAEELTKDVVAVRACVFSTRTLVATVHALAVSLLHPRARVRASDLYKCA